MAKASMEKGFTRIPNQILEAICGLNIPCTELRILLWIIRRTYGFNRDTAEISLSDIAGAVGIERNNVCRYLKKLCSAGVIEKRFSQDSRKAFFILVDDTDKWNSSKHSENKKALRNDNIKSEDIYSDSIKSDNIKSDSIKSDSINSDNTDVINSDNMDVISSDNVNAINSDNYTYKERKKDIKESIKESETDKRTYGRYGMVKLTNEQYNAIVTDYGRDSVMKYISRMDVWMKSKNVSFEDCECELRLWMERDNVPKKDPDIAKYEVVINRF